MLSPRVVIALGVAWALCALPDRAAANEPRFTIRLATAAPDGTGWAREFRAFSRDVEQSTDGEVRVKWYFGGIAGDELEVARRIERGQLDGTASGGMLCNRVSPSMNALRVQGLFQADDEVPHVLQRIRDSVETEFRAAGFVLLGSPTLGPDLVFSRTPAHTLAELQRLRLWRWDLDETGIANSRAIGLTIVARPLTEAARAFDAGEVDGFIGAPIAALAFQWTNRARYVLDLRLGFLSGCLAIATRSWDRLPLAHQQTLRASAAKAIARVADLTRQQNGALLGGLFQKQGLDLVHADSAFHAAFFEVSRLAREKLGAQLVPPAILQRVQSILADYRAEHGQH